MERRLIQGAIAGIIAGTLKDIPDAILHNTLHITNITFWDYAGTIALGKHPKGFLENAYSFGFEIVFSILLGVIFSLMISRFKVKHYLWWGAYYGAIIWFIIRAAVLAFHIKPLVDGEILTAAVNSLNSILYGIVLSWLINKLELAEM